MCGRTACSLAPGDIQKCCKFRDKKGREQKPDWRDAPNGKSYTPSYNIAPGAYTPVLLSSHHFPESRPSPRVIQPMQWGLIPSWHKGSLVGRSYETTNCRGESMLEKMTYKIPLQKGRRCVILAEGFFEWKRGKESKQPFYIFFPQPKSCLNQKGLNVKVEPEIKTKEELEVKVNVEQKQKIMAEVKLKSTVKVEVKEETEMNDKIKEQKVKEVNVMAEIKQYLAEVKPEDVEREESCEMDTALPRVLAMAGLFDIWKPSDGGEAVYSYSVITVESSSAMSDIHHRMPALLTSDDEIEEWLNSSDIPLSKAYKLIRAVTCIEHHPVSNVVNNARNKTADCVKKIDPSNPKPSAESSFMAAWLTKGHKVKSDEPPDKKMKVG